jgi:hypothetical protein
MNTGNMLSAMGLVAACWVAMILVFQGLGLGLQRLAGTKTIDTDHLLMSFWAGFALLIGILQVWHLFLPVGLSALVFVSFLGVLGLAWGARPICRWLRSAVRRPIAMILAALAVGYMANVSLGACDLYDSGLYHLSAVKWNTSYSIVPGIANLHYRLGFNSSYFLFPAMLEIGPLTGRSSHVCNGLLCLMLVIQGLLAVTRLSAADPPRAAKAVFDITCALALLCFVNTSWISSHSTDLSPAIVQFAAMSRLLAFSFQPQRTRDGDAAAKDRGSANSRSTLDPSPLDQVSATASPPPEKVCYDVVYIVLLLAAALCLKMSALGCALAAGAITLGLWMWRARRGKRPLAGTLSWACALTVLIVGVWIGRGIVTSGFPFFPSPAMGMSLDWSVPLEQCRKVYVETLCWARQLGPGRAVSWDWFDAWSTRFWRQLDLPIMLSMAAVAVIVPGRKVTKRPVARAWLIIVPPLCGGAFWLVTAPDPRFGFAFPWMLCAGLMAIAVYLIHPPTRIARQLVSLAIVAGSVLLAINSGPAGFPTSAGPDGGFWPTPAATAPMKSCVTRGGLVLKTPVGDDRCWDAPLMSTPYPDANLELRCPTDIGSGFRIAPQAQPQPDRHDGQ